MWLCHPDSSCRCGSDHDRSEFAEELKAVSLERMLDDYNATDTMAKHLGSQLVRFHARFEKSPLTVSYRSGCEAAHLNRWTVVSGASRMYQNEFVHTSYHDLQSS